jgi:hypothetical protein
MTSAHHNIPLFPYRDPRFNILCTYLRHVPITFPDRPWLPCDWYPSTPSLATLLFEYLRKLFGYFYSTIYRHSTAQPCSYSPSASTTRRGSRISSLTSIEAQSPSHPVTLCHQPSYDIFLSTEWQVASRKLMARYLQVESQWVMYTTGR